MQDALQRKPEGRCCQGSLTPTVQNIHHSVEYIVIHSCYLATTSWATNNFDLVIPRGRKLPGHFLGNGGIAPGHWKPSETIWIKRCRMPCKDSQKGDVVKVVSPQPSKIYTVLEYINCNMFLFLGNHFAGHR